MSALPVSSIYKYLGENYTDCNNSLNFNFDEEIAATFHEEFFLKHSCILPFWNDGPQALKKNMSLCTGREFSLYNEKWASDKFRKTIESGLIQPCDKSQVTFAPVHTRESLFGRTELTIKLPRDLEL
jgi:hypothetical protein